VLTKAAVHKSKEKVNNRTKENNSKKINKKVKVIIVVKTKNKQ
jgi:hypothetical protein